MKNKGLKLFLLATALLLSGCGNNNSSSEIVPPSSSEVISEVSSESSSEAPSSSEKTYENQVSIADAISLAQEAGSAGTTTDYVVVGKIKEIKSSQYGDMTITDGTDDLFIYGPRGEDGETYFNKMEEIPVVGDTVVLKGKLKVYNDTPEMDHPAIIEIRKQEGGDSSGGNDSNLPTSGEVTIAQALQIALNAGETETTGKYIIKGTIKNIANSQWGNMYITDGKDEILIYGLYDSSGNRYDKMSNQPTTGDEITVEGPLMAFKGDTPQMKDATLKEVTVSFDETQYAQKTISEARDAEDGAKIKVTGVVAAITYASGLAPNGFYVVDNGASIYVYGKDVVAGVSVGNTVTVCGTKDYYILEDEVNAAKKWGYKGANQLANARVTANDNLTTGVWDKTWVSENTVKGMMDTDFSEDVTSKIYKVTALVKKVEGKGFTNYYINDLDGYTGTYSYSQANGNDYAWLDEYDGKICTVYVAAHNAKSATSGCNWRFVPISCAEATDFTFDMSTAPKFAYDYYLDGQIEGSYYEGRDAKINLINKVENDVVNFDATVTYTSSNNEIAYVENVNGETILHTAGKGTATITITVQVEGQTAYTKEVTIEVKDTPAFTATTIEDAIESEEGTEVTLHGVVVASVVNLDGFYLQDSTGIISVFADKDVVSSLSVGDEIVIRGTRGNLTTKDISAPGQLVVKNAELIVNFYGNNEYSTENFITGKSLEELMDLSVNDNIHTTEVYVLEVKVEVVDAQYYSNIYIVQGDKKLLLYCSSSGQYSFLKAYAGETVTVELALCNYNGSSYKGCVLSVTDSEGVKTMNTLNFSA